MNDVDDDNDVVVSVVPTLSDKNRLDVSSSCTPLEVSFETDEEDEDVEEEDEDDEFVFKLLTRRVKNPLVVDV